MAQQQTPPSPPTGVAERPRPPQPPPGAQPVRRGPGITWRSVLIGFGLIPLNSYWIVQTEIVRYAGHPTTTSLFFNVIFCLAVLVLINALLIRYWPRVAFTQGELLIVYIILSLGSCMVGHDMMQVVIATMAHPFRFASEENNWVGLFFEYLPRDLMVSNETAVHGYYFGDKNLYTATVIMAWLRPVALWTGFFLVLCFMMLCLNVVWRKQWTENERLAFPIVELPLRMTDTSFALFRNKLMWVGFALAGGIDIVNTVAMNYPAVPSIPIREINLQDHLTTRPWNAIGNTPLQFLPFTIGLGFLLPLDLLFSSWFFQFYWKGQRVVTSAYGWGDGRPDFPYIPEQSAGAYIGVAIFVIWISRHYLRDVIRKAFGRPSDADDSQEPISYRTAVFGFIGGFLACGGFAVWQGMQLWVAGAFMLIYFCLAVSISRMRAELGSPAHDLHHSGPDQLLSEIAGPRNLSPQTLAVFSLFEGFNRAYRSHPMPHQLEGFKLASLRGMHIRPLFWVMLAATLWGTICAFWALLHTYYDIGASTAKIVGPSVYFGWEPYRRLARWMTDPKPMRDALQTNFMVGGLAFSLFLTYMRSRFLWWPFHPVGLAVSSSWAMNYMWFPLAIAWTVKFAILRAGGLKAYRNALPFFLGLVLGEFVVGSICNILGIVFDFELYRFWG